MEGHSITANSATPVPSDTTVTVIHDGIGDVLHHKSPHGAGSINFHSNIMHHRFSFFANQSFPVGFQSFAHSAV